MHHYPYDVERQMHHEIRMVQGYSPWPVLEGMDAETFVRTMVALACVVGVILPLVF